MNNLPSDPAVTRTVSQNHSKDPNSPEANLKELKTAVRESHDVLATATSFGFFPDTITVDRSQITIAKRLFLRVADVISMRIEDILHVQASVGPVFGSIKFLSRTVNMEPHVINYLWRSDALRVKRIAQGYVVAIQREIDCSQMSTPSLVKMLESLDEADLGS